MQSPSFIGRVDALARLRRAWNQACSGQRAVVWVAGEPGIGKTTLIEHFVAGLGDVAVRTRPVRGALRHRRAVSAGAGGAGRAVPQATRDLPALLRSRRADLAAAAAVAQHRGGTRRAAARTGRRRPGPHAARDGRAAGSLHRAAAAAAGDGRPALERPRDDPAHRLRRAAARPRAPDVAGELSPRRGGRAGPSAQPLAARAAPAPPVRGDRARPVLRDRGRRLPRAALAVARARRGFRACAARAHRRRAAVRLVGHRPR